MNPSQKLPGEIDLSSVPDAHKAKSHSLIGITIEMLDDIEAANWQEKRKGYQKQLQQRETLSAEERQISPKPKFEHWQAALYHDVSNMPYADCARASLNYALHSEGFNNNPDSEQFAHVDAVDSHRGLVLNLSPSLKIEGSISNVRSECLQLFNHMSNNWEVYENGMLYVRKVDWNNEADRQVVFNVLTLGSLMGASPSRRVSGGGPLFMYFENQKNDAMNDMRGDKHHNGNVRLLQIITDDKGNKTTRIINAADSIADPSGEYYLYMSGINLRDPNKIPFYLKTDQADSSSTPPELKTQFHEDVGHMFEQKELTKDDYRRMAKESYNRMLTFGGSGNFDIYYAELNRFADLAGITLHESAEVPEEEISKENLWKLRQQKALEAARSAISKIEDAKYYVDSQNDGALLSIDIALSEMEANLEPSESIGEPRTKRVRFFGVRYQDGYAAIADALIDNEVTSKLELALDLEKDYVAKILLKRAEKNLKIALQELEKENRGHNDDTPGHTPGLRKTKLEKDINDLRLFIDKRKK
jgi:hypothetical protein